MRVCLASRVGFFHLALLTKVVAQRFFFIGRGAGKAVVYMFFFYFFFFLMMMVFLLIIIFLIILFLFDGIPRRPVHTIILLTIL